MIHLGFEIGTGEPVEIPASHLAVIGQTQESGKTTTLEALVTRSGLRAIAFVTKRGESSFRVAQPIPPYFKQKISWENVIPLVEAIIDAKLDNYQCMAVMRLCEGDSIRVSKKETVTWPAPTSFEDLLTNARLAAQHSRGMAEFIFKQMATYLGIVVPELGRLPYTESLDLSPGLNVMELGDYDYALQALVVRSCIEWVNQFGKKTIIVIPEAWKFVPKQRRSPVKYAAEEFIRQGAALNNFLWLDSQDLAGVANVLLRQVKVWIFGVQRDPAEIGKTLAYLPGDLLRPSKSDIATLGKGQFIVCWEREMHKVYVQPSWMAASHACAIACGEEPVESAALIADDFDAERELEEEV